MDRRKQRGSGNSRGLREHQYSDMHTYRHGAPNIRRISPADKPGYGLSQKLNKVSTGVFRPVCDNLGALAPRAGACLKSVGLIMMT